MPKKQSGYFQLSQDDREVIKKLEILTQSVERIYPDTRNLMLRQFISGLFFALGTTIGLSIILGVLTFTISQLKANKYIDNVIQGTKIEKVIENK